MATVVESPRLDTGSVSRSTITRPASKGCRPLLRDWPGHDDVVGLVDLENVVVDVEDRDQVLSGRALLFQVHVDAEVQALLGPEWLELAIGDEEVVAAQLRVGGEVDLHDGRRG